MDIPCLHCGQLNESQREVCWACAKRLSADGKLLEITTTKSTKIVIDGKQYERLQDVPPHLRAMLKDSDGDGLPDISEKMSKTWRILPFVKFEPAAGERLSSILGAPSALPSSFRLVDGSERSISWRWISWRAAGGLLFTLFFDGILLLVLFASRGSAAALPAGPKLALLTLAAAGAWLTYSVAAHLINRTIVKLDPARVTVEHAPLPWFGARQVLRSDISAVFSERYVDSDPPGMQPAVTYSVKLLMKSGETTTLVSGLEAPEQALFIEQELRRI